MPKASTWLYAAAAAFFAIAVAYDVCEGQERQATWEEVTDPLPEKPEPKSA